MRRLRASRSCRLLQGLLDAAMQGAASPGALANQLDAAANFTLPPYFESALAQLQSAQSALASLLASPLLAPLAAALGGLGLGASPAPSAPVAEDLSQLRATIWGAGAARRQCEAFQPKEAWGRGLCL